MGNIAGYHGQAMHQRGSGDQRVDGADGGAGVFARREQSGTATTFR